MKPYSSLLLILALVMLAGACSDSKSNTKSEQNSGNEGRSLTFTRSVAFLAEGDTVSTIEVAVADDNQERSQGLMDVRELGESKGMLFIFENEQPRSFWMANTPLPLDIIFVNAEGEIVRIQHSAEPFSQENYVSGEPAKYVIEVNAGYAIAHDIKEGMTVGLE
ncbi:MAG TPA: DUF192 domain-containing protein [Balneolaceae bacterium]|nr:DUF192 domain-containing protein [Balneolaceae bacterium]